MIIASSAVIDKTVQLEFDKEIMFQTTDNLVCKTAFENSSLHTLKIARLVAHRWKKLKFSLDILTFIAIPNEFWIDKGFE